MRKNIPSKQRQKGYFLIIGALLVLALVGIGVNKAAQKLLQNAQQDAYEFMVSVEADTIDRLYVGVDAWFNAGGRAALYSCETGPSVSAGCDANIAKDIDLTNPKLAFNSQFKTLNSSTIGYRARVVKTPTVDGSGYDYKILFYPNVPGF